MKALFPNKMLDTTPRRATPRQAEVLWETVRASLLWPPLSSIAQGGFGDAIL
jgi:hypothetical protein